MDTPHVCSTHISPRGSPLSLLCMLHVAFRRELLELKRMLVVSSTCDWKMSLVVEIKRRVVFLRTVYRYHCVAEAEVIFLALDARVENIACTYYLQHSTTDSMFESIVSCLNGIVDDVEYPTQQLQEVKFQIGSLQDSVSQHMAKEEKQVFPLLVSHFSLEEQASLVWQFKCRFPVMLLEDLFPWLAGLLSDEERSDLKDCINNILKDDQSALKEVVISWIDKTGQQSCSEYPRDHGNLRELSSLCLLNNSSSEEQESENGPFDGILLLHTAIRSDFQKFLNTLNQARLKNTSSLTSAIVQMKFLNEVLMFYSDILEKILYPLLEDASLQPSLQMYKAFTQKDEIRELQKILYDANKVDLTDSTFLVNLSSKVERLVLVTTEHLSFQETEIFPLVSKKCSHESQQMLLMRSLFVLPLGLLKCVVKWFSSHLSKEKMNSVLNGIEQSCVLDKPLASLFHDWIRSGYSGKTSTENLQEMFNRTTPFMSEFNITDKDPGENLKHGSPSAAGTSGVALPSYLTKVASNNFLEPRPMDHIYYFHKAIKKDLESLVLDATKLSNDLGFLMEFTQHYHFVRSLYELHSETEDNVAFPALETNPLARNLTQSYSMDHEMEAECFVRVSSILDEMSELHHTLSRSGVDPVDPSWVKYHILCLQLEDSCKSLKKILEDHILREETELWPLFREFFTIEEQLKILGYMLGRTRPEILQEMIEWLMAYLTLEEQQAMMNFWHKATYCTKFNEWLGEWWEGVDKYNLDEAEKSAMWLSSADDNFDLLRNDFEAAKMAKKMSNIDVDKSLGYAQAVKVKKKVRMDEYIDVPSDLFRPPHDNIHQTKRLVARQDELEAATKRVSHDSRLDPKENLQVIHNSSTTSQLLAAKPHPTSESGKLQGQCPSYRDVGGTVFGCKHYKQNCKLVAPCCKRIFTCRRCHEEDFSGHEMDRKSITQMMCMKCLEIQPIGRTCSTPSCNGYSMGKYYCRICRLFDDDREIYHCPYCNLCRLGRGLGIDYFHCMKCNACMGRTLSVHKCIEKCIEDKCPICQEDMFTSTIPVKSLSCGHVMHSTCFQDYTCMKYTCPICSKSLGDMQVYFKMLDTLLAEEKMPEEYRGQTQAILCNDCAKKGTAPFHWLYHKCDFCGSYNTRIL